MAIRLLVADRDRWRCVRCGRDLSDGSGNLQHRRARGMGGTRKTDVNGRENLSLREEARRAGWAVTQADDPGLVPVTYPGGRFLLTADGGRIPYREKEIAA